MRSLGQASESARARLIGILAHRVLQGWDFTADPEKLERQVQTICNSVRLQESREEAETITADLCQMFRSFVASESYAQLRRATIVGREVPFVVPWDDVTVPHSMVSDRPCVMEGVIDLLYQLDGHLWVADYKTDRVLDQEIPDRTVRYRSQAQIYQDAVSRSVGVPKVRWNLIFLRNGKFVEL